MTEPKGPAPETVLHIAQLARLSVPDAILEETALALTQMLDLIQQLPAFEVEHSQIGPTLSRREDVPHSLGKASLIALSKGHEGDFVLVPPVLKS